MMRREMTIRPFKAATLLGAALLLWGALLVLTSNPAHAVTSSSCSAADGTTTCVFSPTGAEDTFRVPAGVSGVHVVAIGAPGAKGQSDSSAGRGARVSGDLKVTPGQTLYVEVGGVPFGGCEQGTVDCIGGFNGGGSSYDGGGGGGASDVRTVSRDQNGSLGSRLIVAGGGGGSGVDTPCRGVYSPLIAGGSGGDAGSDGGNGGSCYSTAGGTGGKAGGQSAGGAGGNPYGHSGSLGLGGDGGGDDRCDCGGGGGGGYYGGGGGGNMVIEFFTDTSNWSASGGGGGGSNLVPAGGSASIASGDPSITISYATPKNQAPVANDDSATTDEDTATNIDVLSNDTDADNDALSVSSFAQPSHGTVSENADGTLAYTPARDYNGPDSFTYTANDGTADSAAATVNITVNPVNDAPGFTKGADQTVNEDAGAQSVSGWATGISPGPSDESTQNVSFDATNDNNSLFTDAGRPAISPDGTLTYTPAANANGSATVSVKATDDGGTQGGGINASAAQTFKITVNPVNDNPVANPDTIDVVEDTPTVLDVLANDTDVDGDSLQVDSVSPGKLRGDIQFENGQITYIPLKDFTGREYLSYKVIDGNGGFATADVTINVTPVNDAPTAKDGSYTTDEDTPANILLGASDVEGDALTYSIVSGPMHGKLTGSGANRTYTPDPDYNGPDSFTFKASDGTADSNVATVNISVNAVNDAPTVTVLAGSASQSACLSDTSGRVTLGLSDVDSNVSDLKPSVVSSSNTKLVPTANVLFGGSGDTRTATISTIPGRTGTAVVTLKVSDGQASSSVPVTVKAGGNGRDTLSGTSGADLLLGQNGDDTLGGAGRSDVLCGSNGDDSLSGGAGSDSFDGGPGTDVATDYSATEGDSRTNIP